jgi:hypothetical protein
MIDMTSTKKKIRRKFTTPEGVVVTVSKVPISALATKKLKKVNKILANIVWMDS